MMKQKKFFLIAGTVHGRLLAEFLCQNGAMVYAAVATEYGRDLLPAYENLKVLTGRLTCEEMEVQIKKIMPDAVINAAHPYAAEVTKNIKTACEKANAEYYRLIREEPEEEGMIHVQDLEEAADYLSRQEGNIFSACGSKEMKKLTAIRGYEKRVYVRALPLESFLQEADRLGFSPANLICMQGPFSKELNIAMFKGTDAKFLITKNSGNAGGFLEKIEAAKELGIKTLVIGRPPQQEGHEYIELVQILSDKFKLSKEKSNSKEMQNDLNTEPREAHYFPMFVSLEGKKVKVFGAGNIGKRRIQTLIHFGCTIEIYDPEIKPETLLSQGLEALIINQRNYRFGDCSGADLVVAATDDKEANRQIAEECRQKRIPVSVCDDKSLCTFFFPGVIIKDEIVIGVTSSGKNHKKVKEITNQIRGWMQDEETDGGKP